MKIEDIEVGKYYSVRIGMWIECARVDAIRESKLIVYVDDYWRPLPASAFIAETISPEARQAELRREAAKLRLQIQQDIAAQMIANGAAPVHLKPQATETVISRQGTRFNAGDYGITRE